MMPNTVVVEVFDAAGIQGLNERLSQGNAHRYRLRDPSGASSGSTPLSRLVARTAGDLQVSAVAERLGTVVGIVEPGIEAFCFCDFRSGAMALTLPGAPGPAVGSPECGLIHGGEAGLTALTQDGTQRTNLWVKRARMEAALAAAVGDVVPHRLRFHTSLDWSMAGPNAVQRLLLHAEAEFARQDGMATQPMALATFTDLFVQTALRGLVHNYSQHLARPAALAIPAHLRRAEAFMRAQTRAPIGLTEIAAAAECSVRTLQNAFRMFRNTTPHRALQLARLEQARDDLHRGEETVAAVARRYGFSNVGRFAASYARQFGERPRRG